MLLTLPYVKYSQDEIKSWISKRVLRKSITIKSQLLTGPGGGEGNKSHGFHGGREKGGGIKKLTANERGGRIIIILQHLRGGTR